MVLRPGSPHIHHPSPSPLNFMEVVTLAVVGPGVLVTWALSLSPPAAPPARAAPQPPALWPARPRTLRHLPPDPGCRPALTLVRLLGGPGDQTHLPGESRGRGHRDGWPRGSLRGQPGTGTPSQTCSGRQSPPRKDQEAEDGGRAVATPRGQRPLASAAPAAASQPELLRTDFKKA